jgi:hypothetical protein
VGMAPILGAVHLELGLQLEAAVMLSEAVL